MTVDMSQFYEVFFDEAEELLAEAERLLLGIDVSNPDPEELNAIFRAAHSIKGGAATFGFSDMTEITHVLENLLDKIRKNEMALTSEHVDAFLVAKDVLDMELEGHRSQGEVDQDKVASIKSRLQILAGGGGHAHEEKAAEPEKVEAVAEVAPEPTPEPVAVEPILDQQTKSSTEQIMPDMPAGFKLFKFTLPKSAEKDITNLETELSLLGEVEVKKALFGKYDFFVKTDSTPDDIVSICSFVVDMSKVKITDVSPKEEAPAASPAPSVDAPKSGNKVAVAEEVGFGLFENDKNEKVEDGYGFFAPFTPHPDSQKGQMIDDNTDVSKIIKPQPSSSPVPAAKDAAAPKPGADKKPAKDAESSSIRVGIEKVDQLINLVGELVITQSMIEQKISKLDPIQHEDLMNSIGQLSRNTRDLQESVMSIRMMPVDFVFSRFPRMVRDLAAKLGKKVDFITQGANTELDKSLIERIVDPLTHLVRNSVDHGIEMPEKRLENGKQEAGKLTLSAFHKGGSIVIEVTDDGGGLNRDRILAKAMSNGLPVNDSMSDSEVFNLIFAPGFSTAEVVTDVSGRGVGMDVVKRNITSMGGTVDIRSALGYGTTISISLPLTLAILDGMTVSIGNAIYVVPLSLIVETLQPKEEDLKTVTGEGSMVHVRGEYLPIISLNRLFNQKTEIQDPTKGVLVLIESDGKRSALFVDRLVAQQQVVIKSLETNYKKVPGLSGATIMGDGSVALILDVPAIIQIGQTYIN